MSFDYVGCAEPSRATIAFACIGSHSTYCTVAYTDSVRHVMEPETGVRICNFRHFQQAPMEEVLWNVPQMHSADSFMTPFQAPTPDISTIIYHMCKQERHHAN